MKIKSYLARVMFTYRYAKGYDIGDGLAVVRQYKDLDPIKNSWCVIDIKSGCGIGISNHSSKKEALEFFEIRKLDLMPKIYKVRESDYYKKLCTELAEEKALWRLSGYEFWHH